MSYASELTSKSLNQLNRHPILVSSSASSIAPVPSASSRSQLITAALSANHQSNSFDQLAQQVRTLFPPFQGLANVPSTGQLEQQELLLVSQLVVQAYGILVQTLMDKSNSFESEDDYFREIEASGWATSRYLIQTTPSRILNLTSTSVAHLRRVTSETLSNSSPLSFNILRQSLPASLLLTSLFPHMSSQLSSIATAPFPVSTSRLSQTTRRLIYLPMAPLILTKQEIRLKRKRISKERENLALMIGELTLRSSLEGGLLDSEGLTDSPDLLRDQIWSTLRALDRTISSAPTTLHDAAPTLPADLILHLTHLLNSTYPLRMSAIDLTFESIRRPSLLARSAPYLVAFPLVSLFLGRRIYRARHTLLGYLNDARGTISDFLVDWVFVPVRQILHTIRHEGEIKMTGSETLKSDLASLERMVIEFTRDEAKGALSSAELGEIGRRAREGDLTQVYSAFETDIKNPLRSAVTGSLVRCLLIQLQKGKVDVALAMKSLEQMLDAQQLTFGFVGLAPSLIILVGSARWLRGLFLRDEGKEARLLRRKTWPTMRHLDVILSQPLATTTTTESNAALTQGYLLLELHSLRVYARSKAFPSRDRSLREAFLEDVRALEDASRGEDREVRRRVLERLWRWRTELSTMV